MASVSINGCAAGLDHAREFVTTHWSVVLAAGSENSPAAGVALETLCRTYWHPLYCYVRGRGHSPHEAEDLTQEFFLRLLQKNYLALADPNRGRFRSFLLTSMKHFLVNEWAKGQALKRGNGQALLPLEGQGAEASYLAGAVDAVTPDVLYEKRWAMALVDKVLARIRADYDAAAKLALFEGLKSHVWGNQADSYAELAARLNTTEGALRIGAHRLREQFRQCLREEVAQTVATPEEVELELRHLIRVLRN